MSSIRLKRPALLVGFRNGKRDLCQGITLVKVFFMSVDGTPMDNRDLYRGKRLGKGFFMPEAESRS
jgi:hypothetical protein